MDPGKSPAPRGGGQAVRALAAAGEAIRKSIQVSLLEGRPCTERVESALAALRTEFRAAVDRELTLLGTRALQPLFLCVAPALLGLMIAGLAVAWLESSGA